MREPSASSLLDPLRWERLLSSTLQPLTYCLERVRIEFLQLCFLLQVGVPPLCHYLSLIHI